MGDDYQLFQTKRFEIKPVFFGNDFIPSAHQGVTTIKCPSLLLLRALMGRPIESLISIMAPSIMCFSDQQPGRLGCLERLADWGRQHQLKIEPVFEQRLLARERLEILGWWK